MAPWIVRDRPDGMKSSASSVMWRAMTAVVTEESVTAAERSANE